MVQLSMRRFYPYCGLMFSVLFLCANQSLSKDLTLEEVVEALNFSRRIIDDGELQVIYWQSPKPEVSSEDQIRSLEVDVAQWKERYKTVRSQKEKKRIQQELKASEERLEYLTKGRGVYEQRNIVFQVKKHSNLPNIDEDLYLRMQIIDRHDEFGRDLGAYNSYTRRLNLPVQYHNTVVLDGEHALYLWADGNRTNSGSISRLRSVTADVPYQLWGRSVCDIVVEDVIDFREETHETFAGYTIEFEPEYDLGQIRSTIALPLERITQKLWTNPQQGFSVVRLEARFYIKGQPIIVETYRYGNFREFRGGIWYPTTVEVKTYHPLAPTEISTKLSYEIKEADFNIGIPEFFFDDLVEDGRRMGLFSYP